MSRVLCFVLLSAVFFAAAVAQQTTPVMGYQSWACKTPLLQSGASTAVSQNPMSLGTNLTAAEQPSTTASAVKFMYNLAWGPPNYYAIAPGGAAAIDNFLSRNMPSFSAGTIEWTATIGSSAANGFPFGCCGGVGAVTVAELGCRNCISGIQTALPNLYQTAWQIAQNQAVTCSGQSAYQSCTQSPLVPGVIQSMAGGSNTDTITTGTGVTTLAFPSQATSVLAAGVYTFQLWAESICGVVASAPVQLAARCPPSPTVSALLRQVPAAAGDASSILTANADGSYTVVVGSSAFVDASCSFPYQINKPNWPATQTSPQVTANSNFNPTRNLYAIQRIYFSVADSTMTTITGSTIVAANAATFISTPILDQWATTVQFNVAGQHIIVITVTDGCSAGQAWIKVNAVCTCQPVAKAMYVPTLWSNQGTPPGYTNTVTNQMQNLANQNGVLNGGTSVTDTAGVPYNLFTYTLSASAYDYEVGAPTSNLAYDWNFVYWVPDYSNVFTKSYQAAQTLAQTYLSVGGSMWPPTQGSLCSPTGVVPLACQQGWFGLTADPAGTTQRCCFSAQTDLITNVGAVTRPAKGSYLYKVLEVVSNPGQTLRQYTAGTRTKMYNFMRISSGCNPNAPGNTDWAGNPTFTLGAAQPAVYYALPLFLQYAQNGQQMGSNQPYADFNGFPNVNSATPGNGAGPFRPTTECGAWLKTVQTPVNYVQIQTKVNTTVSCGPNTDLVLCRVAITQNGGFNTATATLSVSSFGSCKGQWQFALSVDDSCLNATDYFNIKVGCNRPPVVSAGCTNTQTWSQISGTAQFEQISLDGRASYDPDNFGDVFYGLPSQADTFPGCLGTTVCQNGGLGTYGLTYAWALISYYNAQSQLVYPTVSANGTITGCPTNAANIGATCVQSYCTGTWNYPQVDPLTRMYGTYVTGTTGTNLFLPSVQGGMTLMQAWQDGIYAVQPVTQGSNSFNMMPVLSNGGSTMTSQMIFPDFNAACAPTVYPMFLSVTSPTTLPAGAPAGVPTSQMFASTADWAYAQQIKHVGNSAYMTGLTQAGMYTARLYAFDGCSVGYSDVTFTLECPTMTFQDPATINWGLAGIYEAGNTTVTYAPPDFVITYGGTTEITLTGTINVYPYVNGALNTNVAPVATCTFPQTNPVSNPSSRTMNVGAQAACQNLLFTRNPAILANSWLAPGSYQMVATVSDGCQRGTVASVTSPIFTVSCQTVTLTAFAGVSDANGAVNNVNRNLVYTPPTAGTFTGQFPSFNFNVTAQSPTSTTNIFNNVAVSWYVYWRPAGTSTPTTAPDGGASGAFGNFFSNGLPTTGVYSVYEGGSNNVQGGAGTTIPSGNIANAFIPGGQRPIQFVNTAAVTLSARTDSATGLNYNTATHAGQINFYPTSRGNFGIFWAGDYYVRVTAQALINGQPSSCSTTTGNNADQLFKVTCPAAVDPSTLVTAANQQWANAGTNIFTGASTIYYGSVPFESAGAYCPSGDGYCATISVGGVSGTGAFKTVTLTTPNNPAGVYTNGAASSVSYRITYRAPFGIAPNATNTAANSNQVTFMVFYQNPLLLSPFAYLGLANPAASATLASDANAASQNVLLDIPGTWTLNTFNTNGCANVTSTSSIDLSAYCYDPQMSEANLVYKVYARVPPLGNTACPGGVTNDAAGNPQCDVTNNAVTYCSNVAIVRGPLARPQGTTYARRLLSDESVASANSGRRLLQTSSSQTFGACALNANFLQAGNLGSSISFSNPNPAIGGASISAGTYTFGTTPILSPNFGAQVNVFFNSYDIAPSYTPSTTDLRNFYGMGDLFGDQKIQFDTNSVSPLPATSYQGAFEGLTVTVDSSQSTIRIPQNANTNNQIITWSNFANWAGSFTAGSNGGAAAVPSFASSTPIQGSNFPTGYSTQCSWAPIGTLNVASSSNTFNGWTDLPMSLQGCSPLGTAAAPLSMGVTGVASNNVAGVSGSGPTTTLVVSHRAIQGTTAATNLFSNQPNPALGRVSSVAGNYDYQAIAWNGPVGKSCYDYRAVRVVAVCNRLVAYDFTTGATGNAAYRGLTTEGPMLAAALVSNPSSVQKNTPTTTTAGIAQTVSWMNGMFDGVNVTAGFKYLQCGSAAAAGLGGPDATSMPCGSVPGSRDGEGNYYSLQFSWAVVQAPTNSIFNVDTVNGTITNFNTGAITVNSTSTMTDPTDATRTITTTQYIRTNTWTQTQTQRWVRLLNHGYHYPMTTLRPDVEGLYKLQLTIADGCSTWQSGVLSLTASCISLATTLGAFNNFVNIRIGSTNLAVATTAPAGVPNGAIAYSATVDGSQYTRVTMSSSATAPAGYYFTYNWAVTPVTANLPTPVASFTPTNFQGSVASFVPTDVTDNIPATFDNQVFRIDLTVFTNCMSSTGPQQATFTAYIALTCQLAVTQSNFIFYTPYVNTYSTNPQTFWGLPTTGPLAVVSTFANTFQNSQYYNLYYRRNVALKTVGAVSSNTGSMISCDVTGPYCAPSPAAAAVNIPTILFGGSVPQAGNVNNQPDNTAYYQSPTPGPVWGAGWQQLYFSVPVSLTPNICKIKTTYWVLTGYQNALPFVPSYVPIQQQAAPTCTPQQAWSWTVISTPCQTCNCGGSSTTCPEMDQDVCDFTPNYQYQYNQVTLPTNPGGTNGISQNRINTGYTAPIFAQIGTAAPGTNINAYCVYDSGNRLDALPNINNLRANCRLSGRGLSVNIAQTAAGVCAQTGPNSALLTSTASWVCPMSNIAFVPGFPGAYTLQLNVYDYCGPPVMQTVTINAQCRLKPAVSILQQSITSFYDCVDPNSNNAWGSPSAPSTGTPSAGKFDPITMSSLILANGITAVNDTQPVLPTIRSGACAVSVPKLTWNCTDVKNYVNAQNVMVDTSTTGSAFRSCCQCLYGSQTINVFGNTGSTPTSNTPAPAPPVPGSTTQHNILALDEAEYNKNSIILIALVTPMAVILVGSLAGNVLMALKMRQGGAAGGGYNVRAGDVELSTSPRARVDV